RADAATGAIGDEALGAPVLERVEGDDTEPAVGAQHVPRGRQRAVELVELVVDGDPDRLEDAPGRMAGAELALDGRRDRRADRLDELAGGLERRLAPATDDLARDLAREALLPVGAERVREPAL